MSKKTNGVWTEGRFRAFITSTLRGGMRRYPPKWEVLKESSVGKKVNKASGRQALHHKCFKCKLDFPAKEVQVDHKEPVVDPMMGFVNWDTFIERLFCDKKNLQVLCKACHKVKTQKEKDDRKSIQ
jgi:hypothetical protein